MSTESNPINLPAYQTLEDAIAILELPISLSELHGVICGYLCAGKAKAGETYLRSLTAKKDKEMTRSASLALFEVYTISQHQLNQFNFDFQLLLPDDHEPIRERAKAFSEWCAGFAQSLHVSGVNYEELIDEEGQEALEHLFEFAELDYDSLEMSDQDEQALIEVSEYARMAVIRLYNDLAKSENKDDFSETKH